MKKWILLVVCLCMLLPTTVFAGTNEYRGKTYETKEEVEALEKKVQEDGYFLLDTDKELYEELSNNKVFWHSTVLDEYNSQFYKVYVHPDDVADYKNGDITMLNKNTVCCSYYEFLIADEGNMEGPVGSDIPDNWETATITVSADVTEQMKEDREKVYVTLFDDEAYRYYHFTLEYGNDYTVFEKIPTAQYKITDISSEKYRKYTVTGEEWKNNKRQLEYGEDVALHMTFEDTVMETNTENTGTDTGISAGTENPTGTEDDDTEVMTYKRDASVLLLYLGAALIILILVLIGIYIMKKKKEEEEG